jgi:hypothetical protein
MRRHFRHEKEDAHPLLTHVTTATVMIPAMREFHFAVATIEK